MQQIYGVPLYRDMKKISDLISAITVRKDNILSYKTKEFKKALISFCDFLSFLDKHLPPQCLEAIKNSKGYTEYYNNQQKEYLIPLCFVYKEY